MFFYLLPVYLSYVLYFPSKVEITRSPSYDLSVFCIILLAGPPASVTPGIHTLGTCLPRMTGMCLLCATGKEGVSARFFWSEKG